MKAKPISRLPGLRRTSSLALVTSITAFAASNVFAVNYQWNGSSSNWQTATNWSTATAPPLNTLGSIPVFNNAPAPQAHRLNVNGAQALTYSAAEGITLYGNSGGRGLVIGSGAAGSGTLNLTGGTFSTEGSTAGDILGNVSGNSATLNIDGGNFIGTTLGLEVGLGFGTTAVMTVKNGSATLAELKTNNTTATIHLGTGGTLAMNKLTYNGGGNNIINFDGGTLKARIPTTSFIATPSNGNTIINVKSGGAIIDTNGSSITITRPLLQDGLSTGGGIVKNGVGTLTLGAVPTTTGAATVNAGGLVVPAGAASWQPSSFSHSGSVLGFSIGVYNSSNFAPISTANVTFNSPATVNVTGSQFVVGPIPLIAYSGVLTGFSNLTLNTSSLPAGVIATLKNDGAGLIYLDVTQGGFVWSGETGNPGTGDWDTTSLNWNSFAAAYSNPAPVTFPNLSGGGTVTLTTNVSPAAVDFTNATGNDYVLGGSGKITGAGAILKTGNGTVTLANTNDYSGNTTVTSGILSLSSTAALPGWNANSRYPISSGATLAVQNAIPDASVAIMLATTGNFGAGAILGFDTAAANRTYAANLSGAIGVANVGSNVLTLSGNNSHTGNTLVTAGTLKAGSSSAFTATGPLLMSDFAMFDLGGFNAGFTTINAGTLSNTITDESAGAGTSTLTLTSGGASFLGLITDGPTRKVAVKCRAANASNIPNNSDNTYSGGLTLLGGLDPASNGTRLVPYATFTTVDFETGLVTSGPYGTGPILVGETSTDRVQIYFNAAGRTIDNHIVVNSAAGTDTAGTFRVESTANTLNGSIIANQASAFFRNNVTGGSAGNGAISVNGPISTGSNPAAGLTVNAAGFNPLALTLNNPTAVANSYTGSTTITGANTTVILGAADQIPNGTGKGNVVMAAGKLDLAGFDETINGLSGSGTVDNLSAGTANTLTLGDGDATATGFSGTIANTNGELALVKTGSGIQTLSGFSSYSGPTTVRNGTLNINGSLDSAAITVGGATASGTPALTGTNGTLNGTLLVAASGGGAEGTVNPGTAGSAGSLNVSDTTIAGTYACDLVADAADLLLVNGNLSLTAAKFALSPVTPVAGTYTIATYSGTLTGTFTPVPALPAGASLDYSTPGEINLTLAAAGGYDAWASSNNVTEGQTGDDDKDGISNLVEYALGLNPQVENPAPGTFVGNLLAFTKGAEAKTAGDLTYTIETSTTLAAGSWTSAAATQDADTISFQLPANPPGGKLFARLKVLK